MNKIYISEKDMPKSCVDCSLCHDFLCCSANEDLSGKEAYSRNKTCPLRSLEDHDKKRDEEIAKLKTQSDYNGFIWSSVVKDLQDENEQLEHEKEVAERALKLVFNDFERKSSCPVNNYYACGCCDKKEMSFDKDKDGHWIFNKKCYMEFYKQKAEAELKAKKGEEK